jgi:hypothetical protein
MKNCNYGSGGGKGKSGAGKKKDDAMDKKSPMKPPMKKK